MKKIVLVAICIIIISVSVSCSENDPTNFESQKVTNNETSTEVEKDVFMLYFDTNGGETMIGIEAEKGRYINSINTPKRQGYLFAGWLWNNQPVELPFKYDGEAESIVFLATWIKDPTHTHTKTVYRCITCDLHYGEFIEVLCKEKGLKSGNAYRLTYTGTNNVKAYFEYDEKRDCLIFCSSRPISAGGISLKGISCLYLKIGGAYDFNNTPYIFILGTTDVTVESLYSSSYRDWVGGRITNSEITMSTASYSLPYEQYGLGTWKSILTVNDLSKMARSLITYGIISMDFLLGEECNLEVGHYNIGFTSFSW